MSCEFEHQRMFSINILSDDPDRRYKGALFYDKFETAESYNLGGQWGSSDGMGLSIICVRSMEGYDVVVYSTICIDSENHIYGLDDRTYFCLYDETTDSLVCDGKGKHKYVKYYDDYVYELLEEVNYGACSSVFRFEDKNIVWENTDTGEVTVLPPVADAFPEM